MGPNWQKMGPNCHVRDIWSEKWWDGGVASKCQEMGPQFLDFWRLNLDFWLKKSGPVFCLKTGPDRITQKSTGTRTGPDRNSGRLLSPFSHLHSLISIISTVEEGVAHIESSGHQTDVLVTGSLHLIGAALQVLHPTFLQDTSDKVPDTCRRGL